MTFRSFIVLFLMTAALIYPSFGNDRLDSLLLELEQMDQGKAASTYIEIGNEYLNIDLDSSKMYFQKAFQTAVKSKEINSEISALLKVGTVSTYLGMYDSSAHYFDLAEVRLKNVKDYDLETTLYNNKGIMYFYQADYSSAKRQFELILNAAIKEQRVEDISKAYNNIGLVHKYSNNYTEALKWLLKSANIDDSIGNDIQAAKAYNNIALLNADLKNNEVAKRYYYKSLKIKREYDDKMGIMGTCINIGIIYKNELNYDSALIFYDEALKLGTELQYNKGLLDIYNSLSVIYNHLESYDKSIEFARKAMDLSTEVGDIEVQASSMLNLGDSYRMSGQLDLAEEYIRKGYKISKELNNLDFQNEALLMLSQFYEARNDYKNAYQYHRKHKALNDSMVLEQNRESIFELETRYETEKKEKQIASQQVEINDQRNENRLKTIVLVALGVSLLLLTLVALLNRNRLKKKQQLVLKQKDIEFKELQLNAVIDSQEKERKRFAADLHDGFGQLISILKLNVETIDKQSDQKQRHSTYEKSISILNEMYGEIRNICFNLMPQSLLKFGLEPSLKEFADKINSTNKLIVEVLLFDMEERLSDIQEISLYRIVQEWVNNIIKYSDATKVTVQITKDEQELTLTIEDDGMGFDLKLLTEGKGNGWKNINSRVNLIKGDIEIDTTPGQKGTLLAINIPIAVVREMQTAESLA